MAALPNIGIRILYRFIPILSVLSNLDRPLEEHLGSQSVSGSWNLKRQLNVRIFICDVRNSFVDFGEHVQ